MSDFCFVIAIAYRVGQKSKKNQNRVVVYDKNQINLPESMDKSIQTVFLCSTPFTSLIACGMELFWLVIVA